jgi:hypothetical protein
VEPKLSMYIGYLVISIGLTVWVSRTLFRNGHVFLKDALGDDGLARSVNHLLVVGFYLINLGYVAVALKTTADIGGPSQAVETLSLKVGLVLLVLGTMHFFNLYALNRFRRRHQLAASPPPVPPVARLPMGGPPMPPPPAAGWTQP